MGGRQSKDELLYQEVQNGNHDVVKALHRDGAGLEWVDKEGRTPLILACSKGDLLDMTITLLNLGANINAYRPGTRGGTPLHHAAKKGLDKTVTLLLSRGANPLAINDDGQNPLEMARAKGHVTVVRIIEEQISLFCGMIRELSGPGFLEALAPHLVTRKIWAVVLPSETNNPRRPPRFELVIYQTPKVSQPRTIFLLSRAEMEEPKFNLPDPVLVIIEKATKTRFKFLSEHEGDKDQLQRLYSACKGLSQNERAHPSICGLLTQESSSEALHRTAEPLQSYIHAEEPVNVDIPEDLALAIAVEASIHSASDEGISLSPIYQNAWGSILDAGPSRYQAQPQTEGTNAVPSAPPLPADYEGTKHDNDTHLSAGCKAGGTCVVCWDASAEGVCIPCGHLAACMACLNLIKGNKWGCPVCRASIEQDWNLAMCLSQAMQFKACKFILTI